MSIQGTARDLTECGFIERRLGFSTMPAKNGAQKRTRTSTPLRAPAPEAGASTNSAIWARGRLAPIGESVRACQRRLSS
jgi:hypothetical protein